MKPLSQLLHIFILSTVLLQQATLQADDSDPQVPQYGKIKLKGIDSVVWVVDRSKSMSDDLKLIGSHIKTIYSSHSHIKNYVVSYAGGVETLLEHSTNLNELSTCLSSIKPDPSSSSENLFQAISEASRHLHKYRTTCAMVIVTDEIGDDIHHLEEAIKDLKKRDYKIMIFSTPSSFGQNTWKWSELDKEEKTNTWYNSTDGPCSATEEILFDYDFIQWAQTVQRENATAEIDTRIWATSSFFIPYGLHRLANETNATIYPVTAENYHLDKARRSNDATVLDPKKSPRYLPDLDKLSNATRNQQKHVLRKAVAETFKLWNTYKQTIYKNGGKKEIAGLLFNATIAKKKLELLEKIIPILEKAMNKRSRAKYSTDGAVISLRWRANIELDYALALTARYHMMEYLIAHDKMLSTNTVHTSIGFTVNFLPHRNTIDEWDPTVIKGHQHYLSRADTDAESKDTSKMAHIVTEVLAANAISRNDEKFTIEMARIEAERALTITIHNHLNTPWAVLGDEVKRNLGKFDITLRPAPPPRVRTGGGGGGNKKPRPPRKKPSTKQGNN